MGLFLQTALVLNKNEAGIKAALERIEKDASLDVVASECKFQSRQKGTAVLLNENCMGYEELAETLSDELVRPVLLLYIYDEDFWGYYFYENGKSLDCFQTVPDYFSDGSEEEALAAVGNSGLIAKYFGIEESEIEKYLAARTEEPLAKRPEREA